MLGSSTMDAVTVPGRCETRILVVDDEPDIAKLIKHALERTGDAYGRVVTTGRRRPQGGARSGRRT